MLLRLEISNFAIISAVTIDFHEGLNVLSGETGAGKSVVLHALELLRGGRAKEHFIRNNHDALEVQALFSLEHIAAEVKSELPDVARGNELSLSRSVSRTGKNRVYINGRLGTVSQLNEISSRLISVSSQSEQIKLLDSSFHRRLLDDFGAITQIVGDYREVFAQWFALRERLADLDRSEKERADRTAELDQIIEQLTSVKLTPNLRAELERDIKVLGNAEKLLEINRSASAAFSGEDGLNEIMRRLQLDLLELEKLDPSLKNIAERFKSAKAEMSEIESDLDSYFSRVETNETHLENLRHQLAEIARMERTYRTDSAGLIDLLYDCEAERRELTKEADRKEIVRQYEQCEIKLHSIAEQLTCSRRKAAKDLQSQVHAELVELNMKEAVFKVNLEPVEPYEYGNEKVEFLIATNRGSRLGPLKNIASGGELSRLMLIFRKLIRDAADTPILIFDEVDTGVSGGVARAVGIKLKELSERAQVICVTHLPQVASLADQHLLVEKDEKEGQANIRLLNGKQRVEEVARMMSGFEITPAARKSAKELIDSGK